MPSLIPLSAQLLAAGSATGAGVRWHGGRGTLAVAGTFGGATATMQMSPDNGTTYVDMGTAGIFTAAGVAGFELPENVLIRMGIVGGSGTSINAYAMWTGLGAP